VLIIRRSNCVIQHLVSSHCVGGHPVRRLRSGRPPTECDDTRCYKVVVCIYLYILTVMNTTILQLVAIYNIQLHVSALYVGHHQFVERTY